MSWKCTRMIAGLCCWILPVRAQTNQWNALQTLRCGTPVSLVTSRRQDCRFVAVSDSDLTCNRDIGRDNRNLVFARTQIREVRLELPEQHEGIAGTLVGGVLAASLAVMLLGGPANDPETRGYALSYGVPLGAFVGAKLGSRIHKHGAVIYRASSNGARTTTPAQTRPSPDRTP